MTPRAAPAESRLTKVNRAGTTSERVAKRRIKRLDTTAKATTNGDVTLQENGAGLLRRLTAR